VDEDINPYNLGEVEWALATRFQGDQDLVVLPLSLGNPLDPSTREGMTVKVGLDATKPRGKSDCYERASIPGTEKIKIEDYVG
jgi:2,5-furandicarboxylate decarboxylase 1